MSVLWFQSVSVATQQLTMGNFEETHTQCKWQLATDTNVHQVLQGHLKTKVISVKKTVNLFISTWNKRRLKQTSSIGENDQLERVYLRQTSFVHHKSLSGYVAGTYRVISLNCVNFEHGSEGRNWYAVQCWAACLHVSQWKKKNVCHLFLLCGVSKIHSSFLFNNWLLEFMLERKGIKHVGQAASINHRAHGNKLIPTHIQTGQR